MSTTFKQILFVKWQMEWPHVTTIGRCYFQVADIIDIDYVMISVFKADVIA